MFLTEAEQNRLIIAHMDLVPVVAADFRGGDLEFEELLAIGRVGLVKAARTFNPAMGKFPGRASAAIRTEIRNALRTEQRQTQDAIAPIGESDSRERIHDWDAWGKRGNAEAISELWSSLEASPEELLGMYEDLKGERNRFGAAFISLTQAQRKLIRWVFLDEPTMTITSAARDLGVSYFQAIRMLKRALKTMREVFEAMDANELALA